MSLALKRGFFNGGKMQTQDNQNIVDSIMANVQNWNYNPYKAQTPTGGSLSLNGNNAFKGGIPLSGGGELSYNAFKNPMFGQKMSLGQNQLGTQTQGVLPNKVEPKTWWESTKDFAGTGLGRSLIATGLTGALTAAFGGSPLEALSYGAQAGGTASDVFANRQHQQDKLKQDQAELQQKAAENDLNREFKNKQMLANAEIKQAIADNEYLRTLETLELKHKQNKALEAYKAGIAQTAALQNRNWDVEDRDYDVARQKESQQRGFEHDMTMAGINQVYDIEKAQQTLDNQMTMALLNGEIDKAAEIHKAGLNFINSLKLKQEEAKINAAQPTDRMKNYDYFMRKNESDLARGIVYGNANQQSEYEKTLERERAKNEIKAVQSIKDIQNQTANALGNIQYAKRLIEDNKNLVGIYSPIKALGGRLTNGLVGMSPEELQIRGDISRTIGQLKNNLIAEARSQGQVGINTAREIELATAGLNDNSSPEEMLGALNTMERQAKQLEQIKIQNSGINVPVFNNTSINSFQNTNTSQAQTALDLSDPRVQKALRNGYTEEEIQAYLGGNNG